MSKKQKNRKRKTPQKKRVSSVERVRAARDLGAQMERLGWGNTAISGSTAELSRASIAHFIYLCDAESGLAWYVALDESVIHAATEMYADGKISFESAYNGLGTMVAGLRDGDITLDKAWARTLNLLLAAYLLKTQTYARAQAEGESDPHFIILHYFDHSQGTYMVRPAVFFSAPPHSSGLIADLISDIYTADQEMHPERFRKASVTELKPRWAASPPPQA